MTTPDPDLSGNDSAVKTIDICAGCREPRPLRKDGRIVRRNLPQPSDSGWDWRKRRKPTACPGAGEKPLVLVPRQRSNHHDHHTIALPAEVAS